MPKKTFTQIHEKKNISSLTNNVPRDTTTIYVCKSKN